MAHRLVILSDDCNLHQLCIPPFSSHFLSYCTLFYLLILMMADFLTQMKKKPLWGGSFPCEEFTKILRYVYIISPQNQILASIFPDLIFLGYPFISYLQPHLVKWFGPTHHYVNVWTNFFACLIITTIQLQCVLFYFYQNFHQSVKDVISSVSCVFNIIYVIK